MQTHPILFAALLLASLPAAALDAGPSPAGSGAAAERCEAAVAETVLQMRGHVRQIEFIPARRSVQPPVNGETDVKGEGTYRGANGAVRRFSFSCAYNMESETTSGVLLRDLGGGRVEPGLDAGWQPDLSTLLPEACETAIAAVLKSKYPRVGRIAFGSDSRKLRPAANGRTGMEGQGSVQRAPGMNLMAFSYLCEFEPHTGKVVLARATP